MLNKIWYQQVSPEMRQRCLIYTGRGCPLLTWLIAGFHGKDERRFQNEISFSPSWSVF